jgi:hypothetical protein
MDNKFYLIHTQIGHLVVNDINKYADYKIIGDPIRIDAHIKNCCNEEYGIVYHITNVDALRKEEYYILNRGDSIYQKVVYGSANNILSTNNHVIKIVGIYHNEKGKNRS